MVITPVHRQQRLKIARQYRHWAFADWQKVSFSDESCFALHRVDGRSCIRREKSEKHIHFNNLWPNTSWRRQRYGLDNALHSLSTFSIVDSNMDQLSTY